MYPTLITYLSDKANIYDACTSVAKDFEKIVTKTQETPGKDGVHLLTKAFAKYHEFVFN